MKILFLILVTYLVHCEADLLTKDYLLVYDGNSKLFRQISLYSETTIELHKPSSGPKEIVTKVIVEHDRDHFKMYYLWGLHNYIKLLEIRNGTISERKIELSTKEIMAFDKHRWKGDFYYTTGNLYRKVLSTNTTEELSKANPGNAILTVTYDGKEDFLYYTECGRDFKEVIFKRMRMSDKRDEFITHANLCPRQILIDYGSRQLYSTAGEFIGSMTLNTLDTKEVHIAKNPLWGFAIGSKHLYYTIQNTIFRIEKNGKNQEAEEFYKLENADFQAVAIFEGSLY